ncbi:MAG: tRNA lysidine(34) synthetase TilS [Acidimicrobiia bacterium]|nr:tRNA lysidine(34) synthetase TilS [Acidimicrobiia bacterium]
MTARPAGEPTVDLDALVARSAFPAPPSALVCAVSGGPDSTALAWLAVHAGCDVTLVHVDHGLRDGSAGEAGLVAALARRLGASFEARRAPVAAGPNLEARARVARRAALPAGAATGHTADDRAETMLVNLMRGAAASGLGVLAPGPRHPIVALRRSETHALCAAVGIETIDDPMNRDRRFLRNRIRAELLPLLAELSGRDPVPVLCRQADQFASVSELLVALAAGLDVHDARAVAAAPYPVAATALRDWLRSGPERHPPDSATVERVLDVARGAARATEVGGGRRVRRSAQRLLLESPRPASEPDGGTVGAAGDPPPRGSVVEKRR